MVIAEFLASKKWQIIRIPAMGGILQKFAPFGVVICAAPLGNINARFTVVKCDLHCWHRTLTMWFPI